MRSWVLTESTVYPSSSTRASAERRRLEEGGVGGKETFGTLLSLTLTDLSENTGWRKHRFSTKDTLGGCQLLQSALGRVCGVQRARLFMRWAKSKFERICAFTHEPRFVEIFCGEISWSLGSNVWAVERERT